MKISTENQLRAMRNTNENKTIGRMEQYYLKNKRNSIYIALEEVEDTNFFWSREEIREFDGLWKADNPLTEIAAEMHRTEIAVFLLAFDRVLRGILDPRKGWKIW